jgi:altronate dehydratase large subunit
MGFLGFRRKDGSCGVRNHVVVMSSVSCANGVVNAIGRAFPQVKTITHTEGCGRAGEDLAVAIRTLSGLGRNGNVASVLVLGLGCEAIHAKHLADEIASTGRNVAHLTIQDAGGTVKATAAGMEIVKEMIHQAEAQEREACSWAELTVGLECGGSDALSGITANCLVGAAADWLVERGGTVILSETTEMIGTEEILRERAADPALGKKIFDLIANQKKKVEDILGPLARGQYPHHGGRGLWRFSFAKRARDHGHTRLRCLFFDGHGRRRCSVDPFYYRTGDPGWVPDGSCD